MRIHRRGLKGRLNSQQEERVISDLLLQELQALGTSASVSFDEPDVVIVVETVGNRAGVSIWHRPEWERYTFLHID